MKYDTRKIYDELVKTSLGQAYFGNALRVAKDIPCLTQEDRRIIDCWATGEYPRKVELDHIHLQDIAEKILNFGTEEK